MTTLRTAAACALPLLLVLLPAVALAGPLPLTPGRYNTKSHPKADVLNVHIVPHTHDDVGWLKTVDEYFLGQNTSIQNAAVQYVLDSVMIALDQNPDRKFIYVEIAFFMRWWRQQTPAMQDKVRGFVKEGRLEFINGGWCMSDEAAPFYVDMVDQQTVGHQFLLSEFGPSAVPKTGWQIDPFGHSATMGTLFALMGMDSWFFGRIDYQDRALRQQNQQMEVIMRPSKSLGDNVDIFTGVMNGYGPIGGFDFDIFSSDPKMNDDARLEDVNIQERIDLFVNETLEQAKQYRTSNIMLTMGSDFQYQAANNWFSNLDKLIHYANLDGRVNAFYSTPTLYTQAKHAANVSWSTKDDDWFPYADNKHAFWTGYFTSRPALKGYVRSRSNYLQSCRQLNLMKNTASTPAALWQAMGLAQHHDAVSGTEKQHVAYDYARHLSEGTATCKLVIDDALGQLMGGSLTFQDCKMINESVCDATTSGSNQAIVVYNGLAQSRNEFLRIPIKKGAKVAIADKTGAAVSVQIVSPTGSNVDTAIFKATVPAMGYTTYFLTYEATKPAPVEMELAVERPAPQADTVLENGMYKVTISGQSGLISSITNKADGATNNIRQTFAWFNASDGNVAKDENQGQASGAYIFRPNCTENVPTPCKPFPVVNSPASVSDLFVGNNVQEVTQTFAPWVKQTVRLYDNADYIEVEYTVGPIPTGDGLGKEVVSVWDSDIATGGLFWTDSSGRDMQQRKINYRPTWSLNITDPVSGNFYPVNSAIYIKDSKSQLTIVTDRSQGGASLADGEMMLMVHRRLLHDDRRGVGEPLNEPGVSGKGLIITARQRITLTTPQNGPKAHKTQVEELNFPSLLSFTPLSGSASSFAAAHTVSASGLTKDLPANIHLLSAFQNTYGAADEMILRLSHQYETGEDATMSQPVQVDLDSLFSTVTLSGCTEMSLTANQKLSDVHRLTWKTSSASRPGPARPKTDSTVVTIHPMEIRTWTCTFKRN